LVAASIGGSGEGGVIIIFFSTYFIFLVFPFLQLSSMSQFLFFPHRFILSLSLLSSTPRVITTPSFWTGH